MGEALITRRGGGVDITELGKMQTYHCVQSGTKFQIPEDIEMSKIEAYIFYRGFTSQAYFGIFTKEGILVISNNQTKIHSFTGLVIDNENRTVDVETATSSSSEIALTILY